MIGSRLRDLRTSRGLSLRELAAVTGLSPTLISQCERGVTNPSLKSLRVLADYFGESIATLFTEEPDLETAHVVRPAERTAIDSSHGRTPYQRITHGNGRLEVLLGTLQPNESSSDQAWSHEAVECAYVLSGELSVEVDQEVFTLVSGDAITLNSARPHRYTNKDTKTTEFLLSVTPPTP